MPSGAESPTTFSLHGLANTKLGKNSAKHGTGGEGVRDASATSKASADASTFGTDAAAVDDDDGAARAEDGVAAAPREDDDDDDGVLLADADAASVSSSDSVRSTSSGAWPPPRRDCATCRRTVTT